MNEHLQYELFRETWEQKFAAWVDTEYGRQVAYRFIQTAMRLRLRGERVGAKAIWEWLRIDEALKDRKGVDKFKLNNSFCSYMARFAEQKRPELQGYFHKREVGKAQTNKKVIVIEQRERRAI